MEGNEDERVHDGTSADRVRSSDCGGVAGTAGVEAVGPAPGGVGESDALPAARVLPFQRSRRRIDPMKESLFAIVAVAIGILAGQQAAKMFNVGNLLR